MSTLTDAALNRRSYTWYVGKAIYLTGRMANANNPQGYYRVTGVLPNHDWTWTPIAKPFGEPIFIHDGSSIDLKADPMTVIPPWYEWVGWFTLWFVTEILICSLSNNPVLMTLFFLPWLAGPFYSWWFNVEPVRGTKASAAILGIAVAARMRNHHEAQVQQSVPMLPIYQPTYQPAPSPVFRDPGMFSATKSNPSMSPTGADYLNPGKDQWPW